jgi:colicin import membrane protein
VRLQALARGFLDRLFVEALIELREEKCQQRADEALKRDKSASRIQALMRGHLDRTAEQRADRRSSEGSAATLIADAWRSYAALSSIVKEDAATSIQCAIRSSKARYAVAGLMRPRHQAATRIQSVVRMHQVSALGSMRAEARAASTIQSSWRRVMACRAAAEVVAVKRKAAAEAAAQEKKAIAAAEAAALVQAERARVELRLAAGVRAVTALQAVQRGLTSRRSKGEYSGWGKAPRIIHSTTSEKDIKVTIRDRVCQAVECLESFDKE